jgi:hypothetical protein
VTEAAMIISKVKSADDLKFFMILVLLQMASPVLCQINNNLTINALKSIQNKPVRK